VLSESLFNAGYTPKECGEIYSFAAPHIFGHQPWRVINPWRAKYSDKNKEDIMKYYFRDRSMIDLKKSCIVVAFRLDGRKSKTHSFFHKEGWRPAIFSNLPQGNSNVEPDAELKVWDAAMRTSAAPTFFPVFRGYTDGGIVANNPSIVAVSKAIAHFPNVSSRNVSVLSLGAGSYPRHTNLLSAARGAVLRNSKRGGVNPELWRADWGIKQWIPFLLDLLLDGDTVTTELVMHYLLAESNLYHRFDPQLPTQIALDDVNSMPFLLEFSQALQMDDTFKFIDEYFLYDPQSHMDDSSAYNSLDQATSYHIAWKNMAVVDDVYSKVIKDDEAEGAVDHLSSVSTPDNAGTGTAATPAAVGTDGVSAVDCTHIPHHSRVRGVSDIGDVDGSDENTHRSASDAVSARYSDGEEKQTASLAR
jgi:uncharacterized protein